MAPRLVPAADAPTGRGADQLGERLGHRGTVRAMEVLGQALVDMRQATDAAASLLEVALVPVGAGADASAAASLARAPRTASTGCARRPVAGRRPRRAAPPPSTRRRRPRRRRVAARAPRSRDPDRGAGGSCRAADRANPSSARGPRRRTAPAAGDGDVRPRRAHVAWADIVLPQLPRHGQGAVTVRGRFVRSRRRHVGRSPLPNDAHRQRASRSAPTVEAALRRATSAGAMPLKLVRRRCDARRAATTTDRPPSSTPQDDDEIDLDELVDRARRASDRR